MSWERLALLRAIGVPRWAMWLVGGFGFGVPLLFFGLGLRIVIDTQRLVAGAVLVEAEVVRIDISRDEDGTWYRPVFGVTMPDGRVAEAVLPGMDGAPSRTAGDTVTVLWNAERPHEVRLPGLWALYGDGALLMALGLGFVVIIAVALWKLVLRAPLPALPQDPSSGPGDLPDILRAMMARHAARYETDPDRRAALEEKLRNRDR